MNKERILSLIRQPQSVRYETDLSLVKELIEAFPFYAAPHAMMAKLHYDQKSIYFDKHLRLSAGYIGSRECLYNLLHGKQNEAALLVEEEKTELPSSTLNKTPQTEQKPETAALTDKPIAAQGALLEKERPTEEVSTATEPGPAAEDTPEQVPAKAENSQSKTESLQLASFASYDYFSYYEKVLKKADEESGRPTLNLSISGEENEQKSQPIPTPDYTLPAATEPAPAKNEFSFTGWLDRLKNPGQETEKLPDAKKEIQKPEAEADKNAAKTYKAASVDEIISNFIAQEPRIKPKPSKFFSPEDMARQSAEQDMSLATETLAEIYLKQGLTEKAIEIYRELSARYPLKSSYFAAKIREVKP